MHSRNISLYSYTILHVLLLAFLNIRLSVAQSSRLVESVQTSEFMFEHWTTNDGLPTNFVGTAYQSAAGDVWLGTTHGITRFNGVEFATKTPSQMNGWEHDSHVSRICGDSTGGIWFQAGNRSDETVYVWEQPLQDDSTVTRMSEVKYAMMHCLEKQQQIAVFQDSILTIYKSKYEKIEIHIPSAGTLSFGDNTIVLPDKEGGYWIAVNQLIMHYREGKTLFFAEDILLSASLHSDPNAGVSEKIILQIVSTEDDELLALTKSHVFRYDNGEFRVLQKNDNFAQVHYRSSISKIWFNNYGALWQLTERIKKRYEYNQYGVRFNKVTMIYEDEEEVFGNWKISSFEGRLLHLDEMGKWRSVGLERYGVKSILRIVKSIEDGYWVATDTGLFYMMPRKIEAYTQYEGLADRQVFAVEPDKEGGVWISVLDDGAQRLINNTLTSFTEKDGLLSNFVLSFFADVDGSVWLGTDQGIVRIEGGIVSERYPYSSIGYRQMYTRDIHRDQTGRLWVAARLNLFEMRNGHLQPVWPDKKITVRAILEEKTGKLWVATNEGLYFQDKKGNWNVYEDSALTNSMPSALSQDQNGTMWVSTREAGLLRKTKDGFFSYAKPEGLPSNHIHYAIDDEIGSLWLGSDNGLFKVTHASLDSVYAGLSDRITVKTFTIEDGLPSAEMVSGNSSAFRSTDGKLWIATMGGVAVVDPGNTPPISNPTTIRLNTFKVQGILQNIEPDQAFKPGRDNSVEFSFNNISYRNSKRNLYRSRLLGSSKYRLWKVGNETEVTYEYLSPGDYIFEVEGRNGNDLWQGTPISLPFSVIPEYYQTWWFWGLLFSISMIFLWQWVRKVRYRNQLRLALTRNRIADNLHDDLGSKIGAIVQTLDFINQKKYLTSADRKELARQVSVTRNLIDDVRDSVWVVDANKDTLPDLIDRMQDFTHQMAASVEHHFNYTNPVPSRDIDVAWRRNVYLLFKEALHNTVRHAEATLIHVDIHVKGNMFNLRISDNGKGIEGEVESHGHGLTSMRRRADSVGGILVISGDSGVGTTVAFQATMP